MDGYAVVKEKKIPKGCFFVCFTCLMKVFWLKCCSNKKKLQCAEAFFEFCFILGWCPSPTHLSLLVVLEIILDLFPYFKNFDFDKVDVKYCLYVLSSS